LNFIPLYHFAAFITCIWMILFIILRSAATREKYISIALICLFAVWSLAYCLIHLSPTLETAMVWVNISSIGWCPFIGVCLWFYACIAKKNSQLPYRMGIITAFLFSLFFIYQQWSGNLVKVVFASYGWSGVWSDTIYSWLFIIYILTSCFFLIHIMYQMETKATTANQKLQSRILIFTAVITIILGSTTDIILPVLHITIIPQIADIFLIIWAAGIVFSVTEYGFVVLTPEKASDNIISTISDSLILLDVNGKIVMANWAATRLLGVSKKELKQLDLNSFLAKPGDSNLFTPDNLKRCNILNSETYLRNREGILFPSLISTSIVKDKLNSATGFIILIKDITEVKKVESELKTGKELYGLLMETTPNAMLIVDQKSTITSANKLFYSAFNCQDETIISKPLVDILNIPELNQALADTREKDKKLPAFEFRYQLNSRIKIFMCNVIQLQNSIIIAFTDVSTEREKQEKLYLTDRLVSVGEMASGVAHEINNPLTGIMGLSQLLLEEDLPDNVKQDLQTIYGESRRAAAIVKNLLSFARKHTPTKDPIQLNDIIEDVLKLRAYEQSVLNIKVDKKLDQELPTVLADQTQIQQVFINLILNAESAMVEAHNRGQLTIISEKTDGIVKISFCDDGPGIPMNHLPRIFDPFFTTKDVGKGTGLGLSICYGIVTSHGGKIYAHSEPEKGSTFIIELPVQPN
jgi:PAS domain S-box-containing protein